MRRRLAHLALAVAVLVPAACGQDTDDGETAAPRSEAGGEIAPLPVGAVGLRAEVDESRLFATRHQIRLGLANGGAEPVAVATIQLASPRFAPVAPNRRDSVLAPGQDVSMPLDYGAAACTDDEGVATTSSALVVVDGQAVQLPLDERSNAALTDLQSDECEAAMVAHVVEVRFDEDWEQTAPGVAQGHVVLTQQAEGSAAALHELRGTVIFTVDTAGEDDPLLAVADGSQRARRPVTVTASRCDPHALIESKKTFVFTAMLALDGGEERPVAFQPEGQSRQVLDALLGSCLPGDR